MRASRDEKVEIRELKEDVKEKREIDANSLTVPVLGIVEGNCWK